MLVCVIADAVSLALMRNSIMTEKLARRGLRIHHEYEADVLQQLAVGEVMDRTPPTVVATMPLRDLADRVAQGDPVLTRHQAIPIVDEEGKLTGIITRGDMLRAMGLDTQTGVTVLEVGSKSPVVTYPDESVYDAVSTMLINDIGRLPVVSRDDPRKLVGYLGRAAVLQARMHRVHEESVREPGWIKRPA